MSICFCIRSGYVRREGSQLVIGGGRGGGRSRKILMSAEEVDALPDIFFKGGGGGEGLEEGGEGGGGEGGSGDGSEEEATAESYFENNCCSICLEDFEAGETLKLLPCKHAFHSPCVKPWLTQQQVSCPLCKNDVLSDNEKEARRRRLPRRRRVLRELTQPEDALLRGVEELRQEREQEEGEEDEEEEGGGEDEERLEAGARVEEATLSTPLLEDAGADSQV